MLAATAAESLKLASNAESTALALTTMIGDAAGAQALLKDLRAFASQTPFNFVELSTAAKQLLAMGVNAGDVVKSLRMLGDVSSGLNVPIGDMAYLFGQIKSQGRATTEDLNQFAGRGVPIYTQLARLLKTNEIGVRELASAGKIGFEEIRGAMEAMTGEGGKFFQMTQAQSQTAAGLFSTLGDAIDDVKIKAGEALISGTNGKSLLVDITNQVDKLKPLVVELAEAGAQAFAKALPVLREA